MPPVRKEAAPDNQTAEPTVAQLPPDVDEAASRAEPQPVDEPTRTYHDSLSGRPVDADGNYTDGQDEGRVDKTRIVADDWPSRPQR